MFAKFESDHTQNAINHGGKKELVNQQKLVVYYKGELRTLLDVRFYMGRSSSASVVYCSLWLHDDKNNRWMSGTGSAGGYGYHKESAAMDSALTSAKIRLYEKRDKYVHIDGRGESAIRDAMTAIAKASGYTKFTIV